MRKREYTDEPLGEVKIVNDFLPAPKDLVLNKDVVKVTLSLSKDSVDFFKVEADKHNGRYQIMIKNLLDHYVKQHRYHSR